MIWGGGGGNIEMNLFFPRECLLKIVFSRGRTFESYFSRRRASKFFSGSPPAPPPDLLCSSPWESLFVCTNGSLDFPSVNGMKRLSVRQWDEAAVLPCNKLIESLTLPGQCNPSRTFASQTPTVFQITDLYIIMYIQ